MLKNISFDIEEPALAEQGERRIEWAWQEMPVLRELMHRFSKSQPLNGIRLSGCLHITTETANLARTLKAAGAEVVLCASNPLSTQDDVAAALVKRYDIPVHALRGESTEVYYRHIHAALDHHPVITMDDGADRIRPRAVAEARLSPYSCSQRQPAYPRHPGRGLRAHGQPPTR